jgi:hypothetical protein
MDFVTQTKAVGKKRLRTILRLRTHKRARGYEFTNECRKEKEMRNYLERLILLY